MINIFKYIIFLLMFCFIVSDVNSQRQTSKVKLARIKYSGGGDWYNDQSAEQNLLKFVAENTNIDVDPVYEYVDLSSDNLFLYPLIFLTGHGNLKFNDTELERLKSYLENGGFLYIDDDYGLDEYIRKEMKKVFPEKEFVEIPFSHDIFTSHYDFSKGLPKVHKHDEKKPQSFGIFIGERLAVYYTFESNPSDGWADKNVHQTPEQNRIEALKFGTNIIVWALSN